MEYEQGWKAFENGLKLQNNPYFKNTIAHHNWKTGWLHSLQGNKHECKRIVNCITFP